MTSQSSAADQSIDEHAEEKEVGDLSKCVDGEEIILQPKEAAVKVEADNSKEEGLTGMASTVSISEEKPGLGDVSIADVTKEDEELENVAEVENSLQESEVSNSSRPAVETNEGSLQRHADDAREMPSEVQEISSDFVETSASQAPVISESKTEDLKDSEIKPTSEDGNGEADYPESSKDKADIELIKPEDSKAEIPTVVVPDASEVAEENDIDSDSGHPVSIEVPVKVLEVESGSPEEQKSEEPSSNVITIDAGGVVGSSSHEVKPSEAAEVVERNDDGSEVETVQTSVKIEEDVKAKTILAEIESDDNVSQGIEVKKDDEIVEGGIEASTVPDDVPPLAKVSYAEEKASESGVLGEEEKETSLESDDVDTEAVEREMVDKITNPTEAEVSSVQVKAPATTAVQSEPLEVTSKELDIAPEASEVFSEGDKISAGDEKSESLKGEEVTSVEAPTDITNVEEPLDQVIEEKKTESSVSETQVPSEDKLVNKEDINEAPSVVVPDASEAPEENEIDLSNLNSIEVHLKDLEVESGSPEEEKSNESAETKEPSSNVAAINAGGEVVGSSFNEAEPSGVAEVIEKKNDSLEVETIRTSIEIHEDLEAEPELAQTQSDENVSEGIKVENDDEVVKPGVEISTVPDDIPPLAKVSYDEEKASEPGLLVKEEASLEGENIMEGDNTLVDKETVVNAKAVERDLVDTITDTTEAESPTTTEIANETLKVTSKKFNVAPEAGVVFFEGDQIPEGDEKSESLKGEEATSLEASTDIATAEEPLDQVIEDNKIESSESEAKVPSEDKLVDKEKDVNEEAKEINLQSQADGAHEIPSVVQSDIAEKSTSQEPAFSESKTEDLKDTEIKPTSENDRKPEEASLFSTGVGISKDGNVEDERKEASNPGFLEDKVDSKLIESENAADEIQVFVPAETPTAVVPDASEAPERNDIDSSNLTSIEVPVKDLEVESGSPEEQKSNESNVVAINDGGAAVGSSSYEMKPSGVAEVIEKKNESLEVELAQTQSDEYISEGAEVKKDDGIVEGGIEISSVPDDIPPLAEVSYEEEKTSKPGVEVGVEEETSLKGDDIDTLPNVAEASFEGGNVTERDKLVDKEKVVDAEAVEKDLVDTITDPEEVEVTRVQVKSTGTEISNEPPEVTSKELNIAPDASEVPSDADKLSASDEKIESFKGEAATSVVVPNDITTTEELVDQVIEEKNELLLSETQASSEDKLVEEEKDVNEEAMEINLPSQAEGADETPSVVQSDFAKTSTFHEPVFSESKNEDLKDTEIKPTSENGRKQEEAPLVSTGEDISEDEKAVAETQEAVNPEDKVDIELIIEGGIETSTVPADVPLHAEVSSEEEKVSEPGVLVDEGEISLESDNVDTVPKVAEVSLEGGNGWEGEKLVVKEKGLNGEAVERDLIGTFTDPTNAEVSSDQLKAPIAIEIVNEPLEVTSKELNIAPEASEIPAEVDKISAGEEKSETFKGETATSVEAPKVMTTIKESLDQVIENKKIVSSISEKEAPPEDKLVDNEKNVNEVAEVSDLVDSSIEPTAAEVSSNHVETYETAEIIKAESNKQASEANHIPSEGDEVSAGDEEKRERLKDEDATLEVAAKDITISEESANQLIKQEKREGLKSEMEALAEDKLVEKERDVNAEAEKTNLVDTSTDLSAAVKVSETADIVNESDKEALELTSNELSIFPEAGEVPSEGEKASSSEAEKTESLKGENVASLEATKDITIVENSMDQLIDENKSESSKNEMEAPIETNRDFDTSNLFPEAAKDIIASEAAEEKQDETSNDLIMAEKNDNESSDKEEEVKVDSALQNATDKPEQEELGAKKEESEKSKDQDPIVSSDSGDAKLSKEASKRESNIFSKVKRTIVKAKKAILRKSPGPKPASSEAKH